MAFRILILSFAAGACVLLAVLANYFWWSPTIPVVLGFLGIFVPSLVMMLVMEPASRLPNPDEKLWVFTGLAAGLFGILLPAAWLKADVRADVLELAPTPTSVARVLERDPAIAPAACRLLMTNSLNLTVSEVADMLTPQTATMCLAGTEATEHRNAVISRLLKQWDEQLTEGDPACEVSTAVDALPVAAANRVGVLLSCALGPNSESRTCCSNRLGSLPKEALMEHVRTSLPILTQLGRTDELLAVAFNEEQVVARLAPTPAALALTSGEFQSLALTASCDAVRSEPGRADDRRYLEWVFSMFDGCRDEPVVGHADVEAVCARLPQTSANLGDAICQARASVIEEKALAAVEFRRGVSFADEAVAIDEGYDATERERFSAASVQEMLRSGQVPTDPDDQARMKAVMMGSVPTNFMDSANRTEGQSKEARVADIRDSFAARPDVSNVETVFGMKIDHIEAAQKDGKQDVEKLLRSRATKTPAEE